MRERDDIRQFKNELRNYKYYVSEIKFWDEMIEYRYDMLGASPRSINPAVPVQHGYPDKEFEYRTREFISLYERNRKPWCDKKYYVDKVLSLIEKPLCDDIRAVYVEGKSLVAVARPRYVVASSLRGRINRALRRALDEIKTQEMCVLEDDGR